MRALVIDDQAKATAQRVIDYAAAHHYHPGPQQPPPGDNPNFVAMLSTYRCVFTFTHSNDIVWRHLSISVPSKDYPNPAAAFMIATLFGFTGWDEHTIDLVPKGWLMDIDKTDHCIVLAQRRDE